MRPVAVPSSSKRDVSHFSVLSEWSPCATTENGKTFFFSTGDHPLVLVPMLHFCDAGTRLHRHAALGAKCRVR